MHAADQSSSSTGSLLMVTAWVLLAFAANSLLCRWAMREYHFDPELFTVIRLTSGALMLSLLFGFKRGGNEKRSLPLLNRRNGLLGLGLFVYAAAFSAAYIHLDTGLGAFVLFTTVQLTLQLTAFWRGQRLNGWQVAGVLLAMLGLAVLLLPGSEIQRWWPVVVMVVAGLGWAGFVVMGQRSTNPLADVQSAFVVASFISVLLLPWVELSPVPEGWLLALASGVVASGVGYFGWYQVLPRLGIQLAGQLQLLVPPLAVGMGVVVLGEPLTLLMLAGMALIIGGVLLVLRFKR
ncbi:DMT family transporter [Oceanobacter kriegii]|uniref:DMT family transporter n=1 Tax=Oceanobacter kriegii TaxID=64972 RepID=UPI00041BD359|nr:DMT family transporter [Oceanobacter kriegii]